MVLECKKKISHGKEEFDALAEFSEKLKERKIVTIGWLNRARKQLQLLQNYRENAYNPSHSVYVILMDYFDIDKTYGVYVGETRKSVEARFKEHKDVDDALNGTRSGKGVKKRGLQLLRSLMLYSPKKITSKQRYIYESAVHHCLASVQTKFGSKQKTLRVNGNGKNINPEEWPKTFQLKFRKDLQTSN